jgi:transcriptional regulator GlxA family with amidase domain
MDQRVQKVIALMNDNLRRRMGIGNLSLSVNLSYWRLCHLFKTETGVPPARYLKSLRMQKAKELLETTRLSVKEIMIEIGVEDRSHFERDFKRR